MARRKPEKPQSTGKVDSDDEGDPGDGGASFWEELGLAPPTYRDESEAPDVDRQLLIKMERGELSEMAKRAVEHLIHSFKSWGRAHAKVVAEEYRRKHEQQGD